MRKRPSSFHFQAFRSVGPMAYWTDQCGGDNTACLECQLNINISLETQVPRAPLKGVIDNLNAPENEATSLIGHCQVRKESFFPLDGTGGHRRSIFDVKLLNAIFIRIDSSKLYIIRVLRNNADLRWRHHGSGWASRIRENRCTGPRFSANQGIKLVV